VDVPGWHRRAAVRRMPLMRQKSGGRCAVWVESWRATPPVAVVMRDPHGGERRYASAGRLSHVPFIPPHHRCPNAGSVPRLSHARRIRRSPTICANRCYAFPPQPPRPSRTRVRPAHLTLRIPGMEVYAVGEDDGSMRRMSATTNAHGARSITRAFSGARGVERC